MHVARWLGQWLMERLPALPSRVLQHGVAARSSEVLLSAVRGDREADELQALLDTPRTDSQDRIPTIFLPGFMGSMLASTSGISATLWYNPTILANGQLNLLDLAEDGLTDRAPEVDIRPTEIEKLTYLKTILGLAHATRLYEFPYDWRHTLEHTAERLRQAIERWTRDDQERRFVLVGHSMGGLVARTYAALWPKECARRVQRIVMLGTPLRGAATSAPSLAGSTSATQLIEMLNPQNNVRQLAVRMPAFYQLLPPPRDRFGIGRDYPYNWDVYRAEAWGLPGLRQDWLDHAQAWHRRIAAADMPVPMYQIAGCHQRTMTDVVLPEERDAQGLADWGNVKPHYNEEGPDSGDDLVPLWSAVSEDVETYFIQEHHMLLPANESVVRAVVDLVQGVKPALPTSLPEPNGFLESLKTIPLLQQAAELSQRIESGQITADDLVSVLFHRG